MYDAGFIQKKKGEGGGKEKPTYQLMLIHATTPSFKKHNFELVLTGKSTFVWQNTFT